MFSGKKILITGGTGSWGNELTKQLLARFNPKEIRVYSRGEHQQVSMKHRFSEELRKGQLKFTIGDVRDENRVLEAARGVDIIFHLAALKHVPVCEENPDEAVKTNIQGTQNVVRAAGQNEVSRMILISTDKAVDPLNLYGTTKAVAEKLLIAANMRFPKTKFFCIRGGNVLGTNGSVVPLFKEQIRKSNTITITDPTMTRFFLTLEQAIGLIFRAAQKAVGGEVFVMKMPAACIEHVADVMVEHLGDKDTKRRIIGIRPGEKIHEVLVSRYEASRAIEDGDYYIILPMISLPLIAQTYPNFKSSLDREFSSDNTHQLTHKEITAMLKNEGWLENSVVLDLESLSQEKILDYFRTQGWDSPKPPTEKRKK